VHHYQVAVPLVEKSARRPLLPSRLVSGLLLIVLGWLIYWFTSADMFYIQRLRVEGNWRLPEDELLAISGLEDVNIFWASTLGAERALEALPDVESADVRCNLPARCAVTLVERPAALVWRQGDAQVWIGADGVVVPARGDLPNAIVLDASGSTALKPGDRLSPDLVAAVQALEQSQPEIRVYQYSDRYGLSFRNAQGWLIRLGQGQEIERQLNVLHTLAGHLQHQGIVPSFVDVRFPKAPYYSIE
jgi:cell division septal protein FtsQ